MAWAGSSPSGRHWQSLDHGENAFALDLEHTLRRYVDGVSRVLRPRHADTLEDGAAPLPDFIVHGRSPRDLSVEELPPDRARVHAETLQKAVALVEWKGKQDATALGGACERYRHHLADEHSRWMTCAEAVTQSHLAARHQELETVRKHYRDPGKTRLAVTLQERQSVFAVRLREIQADLEKMEVGMTEEQAHKVYTNAALDWLLQQMRQEWRTGQLRILQGLARELRAQRQAATEALARHVDMWDQVAKAVESAWAAEVQRAQERMDQLAKAYTNALKSALKAELAEAKRHAAEQADFFSQEVKEAKRAEQVERELGEAQLRRMRLTMVKWRHEYIKDASTKAYESAMRMSAAHADEKKLAQEAEDGEEHEEDEEEEEDTAEVSNSEEWSQSGSSSDSTSFPLRVSPQAERKQDAERLRHCRLVLDQLWQRLPVADAEARDFCTRLEAAVPCCPAILQLYEEHLADHGILAALGATATAASAGGGGAGSDAGSVDSSTPGRRQKGRAVDAGWQPRAGPARPGNSIRSVRSLGPGWR